MANWVADFMQRSDLSVLPIAKRDRGSVHFRRPNGEIIAVCTGMPCHYLDPVEGWVPLDTALRLDVSKNEYGAPGLATRVGLDGSVVIPSQARGLIHHNQRTENFVVFDTKLGIAKHIIAAFPTGRIDGENIIRETASYRHVLRFMETGVIETLTIYAAPPSSGSASEWAMLETAMPGQSWPDGWLDAGPSVGGMHFPQPLCVDATGNAVKARQYAKKIGMRQYLYTGIPLAWLAGAAFPVVLDPSFIDTTNDGYVTGYSSSYSTAHDTASGVNVDSDILRVGQKAVYVKSMEYYVYRGFLRFDTYSLGAPATVTQVTLTMTTDGSGDYSDTDFDVDIIKYGWAAQNPITGGNMDAAFDAALSADVDSNIWLNTAALSPGDQQTSGNLSTAWIAKEAYTYYALCSSLDIAATEPTGLEYIELCSQENAVELNRPYLTVTYTGWSPYPPGFSNPPLAGSFAPRLARSAVGGNSGTRLSTSPRGGNQGITQ